jgi:YggT family protein
MESLLRVLDLALTLYLYVVIASAVFSWLYAFNVINPRNPIVDSIGRALYQMTEPVYRPIRRFLPNMNGLDLSPIIVILAIYLLRSLIWEYGPRLLF